MSYAGLGGEFDIRKLYTCMSILNITRLPIALFPMARAAAKEATTSLDRIQKYLLTPDIKRLDHGQEEEDTCVDSADDTGLQMTHIDVSDPAKESSLSSLSFPVSRAPRGGGGRGAVLASISNGYFSWADTAERATETGEVARSGRVPQQDPDINTEERDDERGEEREEEGGGACVLRGVNLTVRDGESIAIVGSVGAG